MINGSNCDRKSQLSGILTELLNPRDTQTNKQIDRQEKYINSIYTFFKQNRTQFVYTTNIVKTIHSNFAIIPEAKPFSCDSA